MRKSAYDRHGSTKLAAFTYAYGHQDGTRNYELSVVTKFSNSKARDEGDNNKTENQWNVHHS